MDSCSVPGCERPRAAKGYCTAHWSRWRAHGDPGPAEIRVRRHGWSDEDRFWDNVDKDGPDGCWLWTGQILYHGYGHFWRRGTTKVVAHRFSYEALVGPVAAGLELDHLCRVRHCVNPEHLEPVTHSENNRRTAGLRAIKTHCKRGHEFTPENTRMNGRARVCRECARILDRESKARLKRKAA